MSIQWLDRETLDRVIGDYLQKVDVVFDVGCGIRPQRFFRPRLHIFCEPHPEYVKILQTRFAGFSNIVILQGSANDVVKMLPDRSVDSVFLVDVIEHLEKDCGKILLQECERIARRQIIVFTPLGFMPQEYETEGEDAWGFHGGEWQVHKSGWEPEDFGTQWDILGSQNYHTINPKGEAIDPPFGAFWAIRQKDPITSPVKFAILSHILPPSPSGQASVLYRLLRDLKPDDYCLLSSENYDPYTCKQNSGSRLPAKYFKLPVEFSLKRPILFGLRLVCNLVSSIIQLFQRAKNIAGIVKQERCGAVVACSGHPINLPAGYLASLLAHVPFYAYIFDDYIYQWPQRKHKWWARCLEPLIIKRAMGVIVPNEFLKDEYLRRYQIEPRVIHNPCEDFDRNGQNHYLWPANEGKIRIVYTGAIYQAHYEAFRNLIKAIQMNEKLDVKLHLYTDQTSTELEREEIYGPLTYHNHLEPTSALKVQQHADILFLPLAFNSPYSEVIKTSAPAKMGEYLASGRPVLVHAPSDSFVSAYFREHECGLVVDQNDPSFLSQAIQRIDDDSELRQRLIKNAYACARNDFSIRVSQAEFLKLFKYEKGRSDWASV